MNDSEQSVELAATPELAAAQWSKLYRENADFRAEFDKDPRKAISRRVGVDIPAEIKIVVHRKKAGEIHITVPEDVDEDAFDMSDISDEALRDLSGGAQAVGNPNGIPAAGDHAWELTPPFVGVSPNPSP